MESFENIIAIDEHLFNISKTLGPLTYLVLFIIVFAETGLVITPFLPGDSLLFLAGTVAGSGYLNVWILYFTLLIAAILGDTVNYWLGSYFGKRAFAKKSSKADGDGFRHGEFKVKRRTDKSFFNYLWLNVKNGLVDTMTGKDKKQKDKK